MAPPLLKFALRWVSPVMEISRFPPLSRCFEELIGMSEKRLISFESSTAVISHPKRLLMPEDWVGYPLWTDYVQLDFYELQDAY